MKFIHISGESNGELRSACVFILDRDIVLERGITHIKVDGNKLTAYSLPSTDFFKTGEYSEMKLPVPMSIETFKEYAVNWYNFVKLAEYSKEPYTDGSVNEGFVALYGMDWGYFNWEHDEGTFKQSSDGSKYDIELDNIYSILLVKNYKVYGK